MTLLDSGLRAAAAAAAGPRVPPSGPRLRLPPGAPTMSEFLLALLALSGLLPVAKVLTTGAGRGKEKPPPPALPPSSPALLLGDACRWVSAKLKSWRPRSRDVGRCVLASWGLRGAGCVCGGSPARNPKSSAPPQLFLLALCRSWFCSPGNVWTWLRASARASQALQMLRPEFAFPRLPLALTFWAPSFCGLRVLCVKCVLP